MFTLNKIIKTTIFSKSEEIKSEVAEETGEDNGYKDIERKVSFGKERTLSRNRF